MSTPAHTAMTQPSGPQPAEAPEQAGAAARAQPSRAPAASPRATEAAAPPRRTESRSWTAIRDNPVPALLSTALVALMIFAFNSLDNRITALDNRMDGRFAQVDARFAQVDARFAQVDARFAQVDARFAQVDARFAALEDDMAEINLKLAVLIAFLTKTGDVDAALAGEITAQAVPDAETRSP